jgi:hypothetical protein
MPKIGEHLRYSFGDHDDHRRIAVGAPESLARVFDAAATEVGT